MLMKVARMTEPIWAKSDCTEERNATAATPTTKSRRESGRNIFQSGSHFFAVPLALIDMGIARGVKPSYVVRYVTLCRVANWSSSDEISITLKQLAELDGVAPRTARQAHGKLQELGMIRIANTKPFTYRLVTPTESWEAQSWAKPQLGHSFAVDIETNWT